MIVNAVCFFDYVLLGFDIATALFAAVSIGLYTNRKKQMYFCRVGQVFIVLWMMYYCYATMYSENPPVVKPGLLEGPALPIVSYIMFWLAIKGIKHDEELIRSADRIR